MPLAPAVALMAVFLAGPIAYALYGSLTNAALSGYRAAAPEFVGLENYTRLLSSSEFWDAAWLTLLFVGASALVGQNVLGMVVALLLRVCSKPLRAVVGALVVTAWVLPEIVAAFTLYALFATEGTLNALLTRLGLTGPTWLITFPMLVVILANVWRGTAFSMLVYGAALSEVPDDVQEAAALDGATRTQRFFRITLPMIRRAISTNLMLTTLQTLGVFTLIWVMTGGGPGTSSSTLPVLAYQQAFKFAQIGYGTAIATVTLLIGAIFAVVYIKVLKPEVD
ncbi:MAG: ABC transporter, permease protein 1 (cluster 1, maltose/g3p/polyamine/iron) [uncultured Quadrisphaera sp.]|uniref:ABC transporter, permease protein 1 (Cluster 1, maltose/g3p/polyamine/iron) n=1 Tax=uncultured Quadrisphaera sp. TaxID=904978 RepID=A0A6J4Q0M6_9ACTN|nr:MAG: ABC transporter, permease protein 1 (cluster 1, maltose/g3p/polyamine/iron) [uncultured Quadrisphaera sp.]